MIPNRWAGFSIRGNKSEKLTREGESVAESIPATLYAYDS